MDPRWWESEEKYSSTKVSLVSRSQGKVIFLRNVKTSVAGIQFRLRLWTTQWIELIDDKQTTVVMHAFDETEKCHLISKFIITKIAEGSSNNRLLVKYEELSSSPKFAITVTQSKIKKSHLYVLELLAQQVAKNTEKMKANVSEHQVEEQLEIIDWRTLDADILLEDMKRNLKGKKKVSRIA